MTIGIPGRKKRRLLEKKMQRNTGITPESNHGGKSPSMPLVNLFEGSIKCQRKIVSGNHWADTN